MIHCSLHVSVVAYSLRMYEKLQTLTLSPLAPSLVK